MRNLILLIFTIFYSSLLFAGSSTRTIDADIIKSSNRTKTFTLPTSSGTLVKSSDIAAGSNITISASNGTLTIAGAASSPLTTKGDLYGYSQSNDRVPVGGDGQILFSDSQNGTLGVGWKNPTFKNYVKNPSCNVDVSNITVTGNGTLSRNTSSPLDYASDCSIAAGSPSGAKFSWAINTFDNALTSISQNCEAKFNYTGTASGFKAYVVIGGTTQTATLKGTLDTSGTYDLNFPCIGGAATLNIEATATTTALKVANVYVGPQTNIGSVNVINDWISYTPTFTALGSVTNIECQYRQLGSDLQIRCKYTIGTGTASEARVSLPTGFTTATSAVIPSIALAGYGTYSGVSTVNLNILMEPSVSYLTFGYNDGTNSGFAKYNGNSFSASQTFSFNVIVPVQGLTSSSNAVRSDQTNYGWTSYTPTFTGFGTATAISCYHKRQGEDVLIRCNFTAGTTTATEARISLPNNLTSSSAIPTVQTAGLFYRGATSQNTMNVLIEPSVTYMTFSSNTAASNPLTKANGNTVLSSSESATFFARVPISTWTENQNAPVLTGGFTSSASTALRIESAVLNCDSGSAITSQNGNWISSIGNVSSGACAVTFVSGIWTAAPQCFLQPIDNTNPSIVLTTNSISTTNLTVDCDNSSSGADCTTYDFNVMCVGTRN